uniref:Uncharacterized protein n=1 Tax=Oryza glumipatula TaxID=40148 RepID=A0A0E0AHN2_9ORYZ
MPVLPWLAAAATTPVRRSPPLPATPRALLRPPASSFPPWSNCAKSGLPPRGPFATAADTPLGGSLPEPEEERDTLLDGALRAARFRDEESRRPDPLFIDPYAAVLLSLDVASEDKDLLALHLMPNGMDTRPYRLSWPRLSVVYDVSPRRVFITASQQLRGAGAKISRNCVVLHTSSESPDLQAGLNKNGFNGNRPSLWVLQGLPLFTFKSLEDLLLVIGNLAMKGSIFIGEVPRFMQWGAATDMASEQDRLENLFFTQGFRVSFVHYEEVAKDVGLGLDSPPEIHGRALFIAEQLRFSDAQMESFRMHFERIEDDADEDGFEEL